MQEARGGAFSHGHLDRADAIEQVSKAWDTYKELVQNVMGKNPAAQSPQAQTNGQNSGTNNVQ